MPQPFRPPRLRRPRPDPFARRLAARVRAVVRALSPIVTPVAAALSGPLLALAARAVTVWASRPSCRG